MSKSDDLMGCTCYSSGADGDCPKHNVATTDAKAQERQEMEFWDWWQGTSSFETRREAAHAAWQSRSVELSQAREQIRGLEQELKDQRRDQAAMTFKEACE